MGDIEHAGTAKAMPAIRTESDAVIKIDRDAPVIRTSEDTAGLVAGEILAEPTVKTPTPAGADKVAAERGMPPISRPDKP
jgi:hypothetical protein